MLNIAIRAARAASEDILQAMDRIDRVEISRKGPNDWVTSVDRRAEQSIVSVIQEAYPEHMILGEEGALRGEEDSEVRWIVDPLDGTFNFIRSIPHFAISIAVEVKGEVRYGVIYDPVRDELFTAVKGSGAQLNKHRLRVSSERQLSRALIATAMPRKEEPLLTRQLAALTDLFPKVAGIRRQGCASLDFAYVAAGRCEGGWASGLEIWDMAAGALLVQEAGGVIVTEAGGHDFLEAGSVVMGNPATVAALSHVIGSHIE